VFSLANRLTVCSPLTGALNSCPLALLAATVQQCGFLLSAFDAFRGNRQTQSMTKTSERADYAGTGSFRSHGVDEASIDLDLVELEVTQVVEARVTGAKIVQHNPHAGIAQGAQYPLGVLHVRNQRAFGNYR
jgi:hypothetical protein